MSKLKQPTPTDLSSQETYDLALGLALNKFNEQEKFQVLQIIKERQSSSSNVKADKRGTDTENTSRKGTKSWHIRDLHLKGKTPKQIYDTMNAKTFKINGKPVKVYFPEIYRITGTTK